SGSTVINATTASTKPVAMYFSAASAPQDNRKPAARMATPNSAVSARAPTLLPVRRRNSAGTTASTATPTGITNSRTALCARVMCLILNRGYATPLHGAIDRKRLLDRADIDPAG